MFSSELISVSKILSACSYLISSLKVSVQNTRSWWPQLMIRTWLVNSFNTLRQKQHGRHFAQDFSYAFPWMKIVVFWLKFHWSLYQGTNSQLTSINSDNDMMPNRRQAIIWNNDGIIYWRIYASLGFNEFSIAWFYTGFKSTSIINAFYSIVYCTLIIWFNNREVWLHHSAVSVSVRGRRLKK